MDGTENQAFVTLTTNDVYAVGAIVWAHSLRRQKTTRKIVAIVTPGVAADMRRHLQVRQCLLFRWWRRYLNFLLVDYRL